MKLPRRNFLHLAAGAAALPAVLPVAWAQTFPSHPVRWIVAFAAGGPTDIVARIMGQYLSERLGQQFIIDNRPGAGGIVGTQAAINSPADGYTLLMVAHVHAINATPRPAFDSLASLGLLTVALFIFDHGKALRRNEADTKLTEKQIQGIMAAYKNIGEALRGRELRQTRSAGGGACRGYCEDEVHRTSRTDQEGNRGAQGR
jgi:Tripartite tricarboxylate transporter family receptor